MQKLRRQSFQVAGPKLWNCLPKNVRNFKGNQDDFKHILDQLLTKVPDEPKADGLIPGAIDVVNGRQKKHFDPPGDQENINLEG